MKISPELEAAIYACAFQDATTRAAHLYDSGEDVSEEAIHSAILQLFQALKDNYLKHETNRRT